MILSLPIKKGKKVEITKIKKLRDQVEYVLRNSADSRNSDIALTIEVWKCFYKDFIFVSNGIASIPVTALYELPREDNIKRIRAKFNEAGLYWPSNEAVAEKRGINASIWRQYMATHRFDQNSLF